MKNWIIFLISMVTASSFCAAENQIQKVTYFPLPYAAYHNINATTLDIGVGRVSPQVSLGQSGVSTVPLSASTTTVTQRLTLKGKTAGNSGIIGKDNNALQVTLDGGTSSGTDVSFGRNLRVNALTNADSVSAQQMKLKGLKLFGKDFPQCEGQEMHWVRLNLKDNPVCSWYLMCGSLASVSGYECTPGESSETSGKKTCSAWEMQGKRCNTGTYLIQNATLIEAADTAFQKTCCIKHEWVLKKGAQMSCSNSKLSGSVSDVNTDVVDRAINDPAGMSCYANALDCVNVSNSCVSSLSSVPHGAKREIGNASCELNQTKEMLYTVNPDWNMGSSLNRLYIWATYTCVEAGYCFDLGACEGTL